MNTHTHRIEALGSLGLIFAHGDEAEAFLQGQLTNAVSALGANDAQWNGYCSPKGRLLATFLIWRATIDGNHGFLMALSRDIQAAVQKRLTMFVMRSKCKLEDVTARFALLGVADAASLSHFAQDAHGMGIFSQSIPKRPFHALLQGAWTGGSLVALADGRTLACVPAQALAAQATHPSLAQGTGAWARVGIRAGVPVINAALQDQFVPQMVNYELLGGVDFKKGCYPGQEVVARSQYLGKLKRRMFLATVAARDVADGTKLFSGTGDERGQVVNAATLFDTMVDSTVDSIVDGTVLLAELPTDALSAPIHLRAADGPTLALQPLPYEVPLENTAFKRPKL
jgi:tRNA-modifying protein YgfZ